MSATHRNNLDSKPSTSSKVTQSIPSKAGYAESGGGGNDVAISGDSVVFSPSDVNFTGTPNKKLTPNKENHNPPPSATTSVSAPNSSTTTTPPGTSVSLTNPTPIKSSPVSSSALNPLNTSSNVKASSQSNPTTSENSSGTIAQSTNRSERTPSTRANGPSLESRASTEGHRTPNTENLSKTNLYIRGLAADTTDEVLFNLCSRFGNITSTKAIMDKSSGSCRGYGFVQFRDAHSAELAVQELSKSGVQAQMARISPVYSSHNHHHSHHNHHHQFHHNHFHSNNQNNGNVHHHHSNGGNNHGGSFSIGRNHGNSHAHSQHNNYHNNSDPDPTNLYIANLPLNMTEQELEQLLSNFGPVVSTRILRDLDNRSKGIGFARMESRDKCQEIIDNLNGKLYKGLDEALLVKFADGGVKKRHSHINSHHHNSHHLHHQQPQHIKMHQEESRWRDGGNTSGDSSNVSSFDQQSNISHGSQLTDLAMMGAMGYHRLQPAFPPTMAPNGPYPAPLGPSSSGPQWIHHSHPPGQGWNYIPQQMIPASGLPPSTQAATASFPFGHISSLTSQMQGLQLSHHSAAPMPENYLQPQHQWAPMWPHPMAPHQPNQAHTLRLAAPIQHSHQQLTPEHSIQTTNVTTTPAAPLIAPILPQESMDDSKQPATAGESKNPISHL